MSERKRIYVSGELEYGGTTYRVASNGYLEEKGDKQSFVTIDEISGYMDVSTYVNNNCISDIIK